MMHWSGWPFRSSVPELHAEVATLLPDFEQ